MPHVLLDVKVFNTGNVDLETAKVTNDAVQHDCGIADNLFVGGSFSCTGVHYLTWMDINSGRMDNVVA